MSPVERRAQTPPTLAYDCVIAIHPQLIPARSEWKVSVQLQSTIQALGRTMKDIMEDTHKDNRELKQEVTKMVSKGHNKGQSHSVKATIIGQSGAGKSALAERWLHGEFKEEIGPTVGANLVSHKPWDGLPLDFDIWDTAGQVRYQNLAPTYMRGAKALIWVVDLTIDDVMATDEVLLTRVLDATAPDVPVLILGNKLDLFRQFERERQAQVHASVEKLISFARDKLRAHNGAEPTIIYMECSAVTGENVRAAFERILLETALRDLRSKSEQGPQVENVQLRAAAKQPGKKKSDCC